MREKKNEKGKSKMAEEEAVEKEVIKATEITHKLGHERGHGAECLKCGPKCEGLDLHFWRKICKNCYCRYDEHDVKSEEEIHHGIVKNIFRKERGLSDEIGKLQIFDPEKQPAIAEQVKANFIKVPEVSSPFAMSKYLKQLPKEKDAFQGEAGQQYRNHQLQQQLPAHDFDPAFCNKLSDQEKDRMQKFTDVRDDDAGQGAIKEKTAKEKTHWKCEKCGENLMIGEVAIFAEKAGKDKCWHPNCFVCDTCQELLVDLIYFFKDGKIFCGRHYGEITRVRCAACDELIFTKEYTQAEDQNWHLQHFCCLKCDKMLGGQKYVARDGKPYCMGCYDTTFAKTCQTCKQRIAADAKRVSYKDANWHASEECFRCLACSEPMLGKQFIYKNKDVYCSGACARK
ncbi:testin-like isoform X1 [Clytia hemisphaerica]|uniref:Testin n=1 Tax=Clytia hemisphaerica TaxID=252671 RepID=A0A7M5USG7_9CNID